MIRRRLVQPGPSRDLLRLSVGAFSLTSTEFILPLAAKVNRNLSVLVMPPAEWESTTAFVNLDTVPSNYLTLPLPLSLKPVSVASLNPTDLQTKIYNWVQLSVQELRNNGLAVAADATKSQGKLILKYLQERRLDQQDYRCAQNIAGHILTALYNTLDIQVETVPCPTSIKWPGSIDGHGDVFFSFLRDIASSASGVMELREGRGNLYITDNQGNETKIEKIQPSGDDRIHVFDVRRRRHTIYIDRKDPQFCRQEKIQIRPTGLFRTVQLACYGLPAHVPWYQTISGKGEITWRCNCRSYISAHLPKESRLPLRLTDPPGAYLWEYSNGEDAVSTVVEKYLGKLNWRVDPARLSWLCALPSGRRVRSRLYHATRGLIQIHTRAILSMTPPGYRNILELTVTSTNVWAKICAWKKALFAPEEMCVPQGDFFSYPDIIKLQKSAYRLDVRFERYQPLVTMAFDNLKEGSEHRYSTDRDILTRIARGWLEISTTLLYRIFLLAGAQLQATLPILGLLRAESRPILQLKESTIVLRAKRK